MVSYINLDMSMEHICSIHAPWVADSLSTPCSSLSCFNKNHLRIFASPIRTPPGQKRWQRNSSQPLRLSISSDGSSHWLWPAGAITVVMFAFLKVAKQQFFPLFMDMPCRIRTLRACQLIKTPDFSGPSLIVIYRMYERRFVVFQLCP